MRYIFYLLFTFQILFVYARSILELREEVNIRNQREVIKRGELLSLRDSGISQNSALTVEIQEVREANIILS